MALVEFTSFDEVRAALGVSDDEIEDSTLALPIYEFNLKQELRAVSAGILSSFATVSTISADSRSDLEAQLYEAVWLFSTYAVALHLTTSLPMFSPKEMTDSKASFVRYAQGNIESVVAGVRQQYEASRAILSAVLNDVVPTADASQTTRSYVAKAGLPVNPVTNS